MIMAEFKGSTVRKFGMYYDNYKVTQLASVHKKRLADAVRKRFRISDFKIEGGTFHRRPAFIFTGKKNGFKIRISKIKREKGFYGDITKRGKGESLFVTNTLKEALGASSTIIKEAKGHGRVLRAS
jgi:hypothetical protein